MFSNDFTCHYPSLRGRGRLFDTPARDNITDLVDDILPTFLALKDKPISFFGHSMGGLIAYELAIKLVIEYGIVPEHIFISAFRPPQMPHEREPLHMMSDFELYTTIKAIGGISEDISYDNIKPFLPTLTADFKLCETYTCMHSIALPCQMTIIWGDQDTLLPLDEMGRWQEKSDFKIKRAIFKGGHFYLSENVIKLTNLIQSTILE